MLWIANCLVISINHIWHSNSQIPIGKLITTSVHIVSVNSFVNLLLKRIILFWRFQFWCFSWRSCWWYFDNTSKKPLCWWRLLRNQFWGVYFESIWLFLILFILYSEHLENGRKNLPLLIKNWLSTDKKCWFFNPVLFSIYFSKLQTFFSSLLYTPSNWNGQKPFKSVNILQYMPVMLVPFC
jgi:hypothetical protein